MTEESHPYFFRKDAQARKKYLREHDEVSRAYKKLADERMKE